MPSCVVNFFLVKTKSFAFYFTYWWFCYVSSVKVYKWTISASGMKINNLLANLMRYLHKSCNLTQKIYNSGIIKYNPWCTYSPLVPKWDTFMLEMVQPCLS